MGNAGRVLMIPKGEYNSATTYEMLDFVYYQGRSYVCKQTSTGNAPTNTTYWQALTGDASAEIQALTNYVTDTGVKNFLNVTATTTTDHGVTFTVNADKTITVSGTADGLAALDVSKNVPLKPDNYILSGNGATNIVWNSLVLYNGSTLVETIDLSSATGSDVPLNLASKTFDNVTLSVKRKTNGAVSGTISPMIRLASITDPTYQPYAKTNVELTEDTTAKIITFTPTDSSKADLDWGEFVKAGNLVMGTVAFTVKNVTAGTEISLGTLPYQPVNAKAIPVVDTYGRNEFAGYISILGNTNTLKYLPAETVIQGRICGTLIFLIK